MKITIRFLILSAFALSFTAAAQTMSDEERAFLVSVPPGLQSRQERAVRDAVAGDFSGLLAVRASRNTAATLPEGVKAIDIGDRYRLYIPADSAAAPLLLLIYLHGGGWCFGSINSCSRFCGELVAGGGLAVLAVDYPLAPEYPYPAALESSLDAVRFAFDNCQNYGIDARSISIGGDSAGGNLALAAALRLCADGDGSYCPASVIAFYPVVKAWNDGSASWRAYATGYGLDAGIMEAFNEAYIGADSCDNPFISPFCAPAHLLAALPPAMIVNAGHDILHDQGAEMARLLHDNGVSVTRTVLRDACHLFITVDGQETARCQAVALSRRFLLSAHGRD